MEAEEKIQQEKEYAGELNIVINALTNAINNTIFQTCQTKDLINKIINIPEIEEKKELEIEEENQYLLKTFWKLIRKLKENDKAVIKNNDSLKQLVGGFKEVELTKNFK